jgi:hypothetical protein
MRKGKTLREVFDDEVDRRIQAQQKGNFNVAGQVIVHSRLTGEWVIVATQMAGGSSGEGMNGHDDYPDGHQLVLRKLVQGSLENIDWKEKEQRFYQSGCFIEEAMLTNPKMLRDLT